MKRHGAARSKTWWMGWGLAFCAATGVASAEQTGTVTLHINTDGIAAAAGTPVSSGVPFPMGAVATVDHLRLETQQGSPINANFRSLVAWPDGSVKSALVSFVPSAQSGTYADVVLRYGPTVSHSATGPVQVTEDSQGITVTTDLLKVQFSKTHFSVFEQVWSDLNLDGTFGSGEQWLTTPADLQILDKKTGKTFSSLLWTAADGYTAKLVESGPAKAVVLLDGRLKGVGGALTAEGDTSLVRAKIWLSIYAGSSVVQMESTIIDDKYRPTDIFTSSVMDLGGVTLNLPTVLSGANYAAGGESGAVYQGAVGQQAQLYQDADVSFTSSFSYNFHYTGVGTGAKAPGWMDASTSTRGTAIGITDFWKNFPHRLTVQGTGQVSLEYLAIGTPNNFWTVYPGVGKTYEGFVDFHAGAYSSSIQNRAQLVLVKPLLIADRTWYSSTQAFGPLAPPSANTQTWEAQMEQQYNCSVLVQGCSTWPRIYGQRNFGDYQFGFGTNSAGQPFPEYGDEHYEDAHGFLLHFARTGDRRWFNHAAAGARHHYDLDVMHAQNAHYPGMPPGMIHWHGSTEHEGANIETGHVVPGGLDEYYFLTGDPRAYDVMREQGDWVEAWARGGNGRVAPEISGESPGYYEYERPTAWTLYTAMKSYEGTGDPKYLEAASIFVKNTIDWWKWPQDHIVFDSGKALDLAKSPQSQAIFYERADWTQGTGYPLPTLRVDNCAQTSAPLNNYPYQTHAPIAWMSGLLQNALIRYYWTLQRLGGTYNQTVLYRGQQTPITIDDATMREILIQLAKKIADYTYLGTGTTASLYPWLAGVNNRFFVYSVCPERDPSVGNGGQYLAYSFLFVSNFPQSQVSSRWQANWAQMVAKWRNIALEQYKVIVVERGYADTSYGGVGDMWAMPYATAALDQLGMLTGLPAPGATTTMTTPTSSGGSTTTSASSDPAYRVSVLNDGSPVLTSPLVDLKVIAPSTAAQINISTTDYGQGTWQQMASEIHGVILPSGSGQKTLFIQFKDNAGNLLATLTRSFLLIEPGFTGTVNFTLREASDSFVYSNSPDNNYAARTRVYMGKYDNGFDYQGLIKFPMPTFPAGVSATVLGANLQVFYMDNDRNAAQDITPYEITSTWAEDAVTWNAKPSLSSSAVGSVMQFPNANSLYQWKTSALTPSVIQRWLQDPTKAYGIALTGQGTPGMTSIQVASSEAFDDPTFDKRPKLVLQLSVSNNDSTPPVISNLQAVSIGQSSAVIQWTTDENADGQVEYGLTTAYGQTSATQTTLSTTHAIQLNGLTPLTPYHGRVYSADASGNRAVSSDITFTTTSVMPGDLNRDGQVNTADLPLLIGQLLGISGVTPDTADVNADGRVNIADVQTLVNRITP